jgi:hypothetical protein
LPNTNNIAKLYLSPKFNLNVLKLDVEFQQSVYSRTGQSAVSFSSGSQTQSVNLSTLLAATNNMAKFVTSGVPNFEIIRVTGITITWFPSTYIPVQGTFEPTPFILRYHPNYSTSAVLPSGYSGNYNEGHFKLLLQQTSRPSTFVLPLKSLPPYLVTEANRQCIGAFVNAYNFVNYPSDHGGLLSIIQTTPTTNSISAYNPKLGYLLLKYHVELYNSIV